MSQKILYMRAEIYK